MSRILVVDDSRLARKLIIRALKVSPEDVAEAVDGRDALEKIEESAPQLVVSDLVMPRVDGLQLVKQIHRRWPKIPVILVTSHGNEDIAARALQLGATSYVPKTNLDHSLDVVARRILQISDKQRARELLYGRLKRTELLFELNNDRAVISPLVQEIRNAVSAVELCDDTELNQVAVALDEGMMNAIVHGNLEVSSKLREREDDSYEQLIRQRMEQEPYCSRTVEVDVKINSERAWFRIRDQGSGFDQSELPDPHDSANLGLPHGRGVMLMCTFMDDIDYNEAGNVLTLVKLRSRSDAS